MILKIGLQNTGDLKVEDDLLIEKVRLEDSVFTNTNIKLVAFYRLNSPRLNLIQLKTTALLKKRNLHTIALDFYMGMVLALEKADSLGIS